MLAGSFKLALRVRAASEFFLGLIQKEMILGLERWRELLCWPRGWEREHVYFLLPAENSHLECDGQVVGSQDRRVGCLRLC